MNNFWDVLTCTLEGGIYYKSQFFSRKDLINGSKAIGEILIKNKKYISEKVAIIIPNSANYVLAFFGISYTRDNIIVPLYSKITTGELERELVLCDVNSILVDNTTYYTVKQNLKFINRFLVLFNIDSLMLEIFNEHLYCSTFNCNTIKPHYSDATILLQTSGSIHNPKNVLHSDTNIINNAKMHIKAGGLSRNEKTSIYLPMLFSATNTASLIANLLLGSEIYICDTPFTPAEFINKTEMWGITHTALAPVQLIILCNGVLSPIKLKTLKLLYYGGSFLPRKFLRELVIKLPGISFINTYGQTEAAPRLTENIPFGEQTKFGSVGKPLHGICIKIIDDNDVELPPMKEGNIVAKTPCLMLGYYKNQNLTNEVIRNGWLYTGDIGYKDADGYLYLTGRKKNIIINGGINIYPEEIEDVLLEHPNILQVLVSSMKHDLVGEVPIAKVVVNDESQFNEEEIKRFCAKKLSLYKVPAMIIPIKHINYTPTGKVIRYNEN